MSLALANKKDKSSAGYVQQAKVQFEREAFQKALSKSRKAIKLDPNNQAAYLLAGVSWVKLGSAANAKRQFQEAIRLDPNTPDGATARSWLDRLQYPLAIALYPFRNLSGHSYYGSERRAHQLLTKFLFESGLYSIVGQQRSRYWNSRAGSIESRACEDAKKNGAKIVILGVIGQSETWPYKKQGRFYYAAKAKVALQLYAASNCRFINVLSEAVQSPGFQSRSAAITRALEYSCQRLALGIHKTLN